VCLRDGCSVICHVLAEKQILPALLVSRLTTVFHPLSLDILLGLIDQATTSPIRRIERDFVDSTMRISHPPL
jgi:hypothetical protein